MFNRRNCLLWMVVASLLGSGCSKKTNDEEQRLRLEEWPQLQSALRLILPEEPYASIEEIHRRAEAGDPESKALLVQEYFRGDLTNHDSAKAIHYLKEAREVGHPIASYFFAYHQTVGLDGTPRIEGSGKRLWQTALRELEAVENPSGHVLDAICMIYASGRAADEPNFEKAWEACLRACEHELPQPWARRAWFHEVGEGGAPESFSEAFRCYAKAARLGSALANHHLARCYLEGLGGEKNREMALGYLARAAQKGVPDAVKDLEKLLVDDLNFLAQGNTRVLVENSQEFHYRFAVGDQVTVALDETGYTSWSGSIVDQRKGKYKVKVESVSPGTGGEFLSPCPCTGQEILDTNSVGEMFAWIPETCAEAPSAQDSASLSLSPSTSSSSR